MSFYEALQEEEAAARRWEETHPPKGARLRLRDLEFVVVQTRPLAVVGPAGRRRELPADVLARMERVATEPGERERNSPQIATETIPASRKT